MKTILRVAVAASMLIACSNEPASTNNDAVSSNNGASNNGDATSNGDVDPGPMMLPVALQQAMDENCISCHQPGGVAPFDFTDQATVVAVGELMAAAVESRRMPPWNADPTCADLQGELRLSEEQIALFTDWVDAGKPLVPEEPFERLQPKNPEIGAPPSEEDEVVDLIPVEPYSPVFGRTESYLEDDFRCFVVDPGFTEDRQLTGFEVLVDNVEVAHHMVVLTASGDEENRAALAAREAEDPEPGFSCFGVSGFDVDGIAAVWAPGGGRVGFPERQALGQTAVDVAANSLFVIQMHYNKPTADWGSDQSGVRMWFRPPGEPVHDLAQADWAFVGNLPFRIPAGVDGTGVADEDCDVVYATYELDDNDTPISPPAVGFDEDEVECGLDLEDCAAEFGEDAEECAIDYSVRLRIDTLDPAASYSIEVAGTTVTVDASSMNAVTTAGLLEELASAINAEASLQGMVSATTSDRDTDGVADEVVVANTDGAAAVRTHEFTATGEARVSRRYADRCARFEPSRLVEARSVGSSGCVQTDIYYRNPAPLKAWAAFSHMHLLGQRIETEILEVDDDGAVTTPDLDTAECAARTDEWNFDWQRTYWFQEPKDIPRKGLIRLRCRYDNSRSDAEVRLGDGSGSEMCLALFYLTL